MSEHEPCIGASDEWTRVRDLLNYETATGVFSWRINIGNIKAGTVTGSRTKKGYLLIRVDRRAHLAHRLAWFWMTGEWPKHQIDHRNLKKDDNRWDNLRPATNAENHLNRTKNSNNTSGYKGVSLDKKTGRYSAYLTLKGKRSFLGSHREPGEAHAAYLAALLRADPEFGRAK